VVKQI